MGCAASVRVDERAVTDFDGIAPEVSKVLEAAADRQQRVLHTRSGQVITTFFEDPHAPREAENMEDQRKEQELTGEHVDDDIEFKEQVSVKVVASNGAMAKVVRGEVLDNFEPVQQMSSSFRLHRPVHFAPDRRTHERHVGEVDRLLRDIKGHPKIFVARVNTRRRFLAILSNQPGEVTKAKSIF